MRRAVSAFTFSGELRKRDTVEMLTPAWAATLYIVDSPLRGMLSLLDESVFMKVLSLRLWGILGYLSIVFFGRDMDAREGREADEAFGAGSTRGGH